ncbi:MAG: NTP transferase domain-containing protein [Anaerovoracaceae bacterium]
MNKIDKFFVREKVGAIIVDKNGSVTGIRPMVTAFYDAGIRNILVVTTKKNHIEMEKHLAKMGVTCLWENLTNEDQLFNFFKVGFNYLKDMCDLVFVTPMDSPIFLPETLEDMIASGAKICNPFNKGQIFHPLLIHKDVIENILDFDGDYGLKGAIDSSGFPRAYIETAKEPNHFNESKFKPSLRIRLTGENHFFGPGTEQLLKLIDKNKSVRIACMRMGISYSKGLKMIKIAENETRMTIVKRQQGGKNGGAAFLTDEGHSLLEKYQLLEWRCEEAMSKIFNEIF